MTTNSSKNSVVNGIKLYLFPTLVSILSMMIWRDVTEMRNDIKMLLAQSNIDKTKIEQLEKDVRFLEQSIFSNRIKTTSYIPEFYHDKYFKHEEFFDIKKYKKENNKS
jgi:hypothetical protein